jgi:hypothetical protein
MYNIRKKGNLRVYMFNSHVTTSFTHSMTVPLRKKRQ